MDRPPFEIARDELKALGIVLDQTPGQYRVNFVHGTAATERVTDDLRDALAQGRLMALLPAALPPPPPLGPTGPRSSRRGFMYRHNRKLAARRKRGQ